MAEQGDRPPSERAVSPPGREADADASRGATAGGGDRPSPGQRSGTDDARRRRGERRQAGFADGIERAVCAAVRAVPPVDFPVQHRTGVATLRPVIVDRRPGALLLCDGSHDGEHRWPTGDGVDADAADETSG